MFYGHIDKNPYGDTKDKPSDPKLENKSDMVTRGQSMSGKGTGHDLYSAYAFMLAVKTA